MNNIIKLLTVSLLVIPTLSFANNDYTLIINNHTNENVYLTLGSGGDSRCVSWNPGPYTITAAQPLILPLTAVHSDNCSSWDTTDYIKPELTINDKDGYSQHNLKLGVFMRSVGDHCAQFNFPSSLAPDSGYLITNKILNLDSEVDTITLHICYDNPDDPYYSDCQADAFAIIACPASSS